MKLLTSLIITLALAAPLLAQTPAPGSNEAEQQAKFELLEAARVFRQGDFAAAQVHSEKALRLDPQNQTAPYFVARSTHAQYKPGDPSPENVSKAREAITAYQRILERFHGDDEAYKAIAYLYGAIKEDELLREWIVQRSLDVSLPNEKRAEAFVVLASREWDCSFQITELPHIKVTTTRRNKAYVSYRMPTERAEFEKATACANRGLEFANTAIVLRPEDESAWSYKTNLILELTKLAEMSGQLKLKRDLQQQYDQALKETTRLSNRPKPPPPIIPARPAIGMIAKP